MTYPVEDWDKVGDILLVTTVLLDADMEDGGWRDYQWSLLITS
jgi:hypothetical protein